LANADSDSDLEIDMRPERRTGDRPLMITEIRAWLLAALVIVGQTVTAVWWAASLSTKVENLVAQGNTRDILMARQYTVAEAEKDFSRANGEIAELKTKVRTLEQEVLTLKVLKR
jgi:TolA-binding protein